MTDEQKREIYEQIVQEKFDGDIVVVEDVHIMPQMNVEYHSQYFYLGICLKGEVNGMYDYHPIHYKAGDISWVLPDHVLAHDYISDDYSVTSVFISRPFYQQLRHEGMLGNFRNLANLTTLSLSPDVFETVYSAFKLLGRLTKTETERKKCLISFVVNIISMLFDDFISSNSVSFKNRQTYHDELFERFHEAISNHYRESREVKFYANLFCLTPKYFSTVIKQTTGVSALEWINRYVIVESKWMLLHDRHLSIQQIAHQLGFKEQAAFCRLFKQYEGITPKEFRQKG